MKGMNAKLVLNDSTTYSQHILLDKLRTSCAEHDVPDVERTRIIDGGLTLFGVEPSGLHTVPLGKYTNIDDYVKAHQGNIEMDDNSHLTKSQLYKRLLKAATVGNIVEYRRLREQYTAAE